MPKVTVYIPTYNYAKYIGQAVESILNQTMADWELIIINDGSADNTTDILRKYDGNNKIRIIDQENKGLNVTNNIALRLARGKYIMRLDGDDYADENLLLVLSNALDAKPEAGLVYPDYYHISEAGEILEMVRRKKIGKEDTLLDLPAHGAGTMFRKDLLLEMGGYLENFSCQDGYELWLRFIRKYKPQNVNLPLFYYRQHQKSLTRDQSRILEARGKIKSLFVEKHFEGKLPRVLGIVLAIANPVYSEAKPFVELADKPLIWYTLNQVQKAKTLDKIVVSSDDQKVLEYAKQFPGILPFRRPKEYTKTSAEDYKIAEYVIGQLREKENYEPDAVAILYSNTPLRKAYHIDKAVNTMMIFDVDSVISIQEELAPCYQHQEFGLKAIDDRTNKIRIERKAIYKENGAIYLSKREVLKKNTFLGKKVGHITMLPEESIKINSAFELWLARKIIEEKKDSLNGSNKKAMLNKS